jgi:hypothetical protein
MQELHENEQYFFDQPTLMELERRLSGFDSICCLCAPTLAGHLAAAGMNVTNLDIDRRFEGTPGFRYFDLLEPQWLGENFDVIFCDPPFFNVSFRKLHTAIRTLAKNDFDTRVWLTYLDRRSVKLMDAFSDFKLQPTEYFPQYQTVEDCDKNRIRLFCNDG